jgi:hypothetical protein
MTTDQNFNVEPVNLRRVAGTSPSGDQTGKRRQERKGPRKADEPSETIEKMVGEHDDSGDETFHVIDYRA